METSSARHTEISVEPLFLHRWSPRSFSAEAVDPEALASMFEAARWSPSCFNAQPWLFVHASRGPGHERVLELLGEANQGWAGQAPVLGVVFARRRFEHNDQPNPWAAFDAGAAALAMSLQGQSRGLSTHLMGGFDAERAPAALGLDPADYQAVAAYAIGKRGPREALPAEPAERAHPSARHPLAEVAPELG